MTTRIEQIPRALAFCIACLCLVTVGCSPAPPAVTERFKNFHITGTSGIIVATYASSGTPVILKAPEAQYENIPAQSETPQDWVDKWYAVPGGEGWQSAPLPDKYTVNSEGQLVWKGGLSASTGGATANRSGFTPLSQAQAPAQYSPQPAALVYKAGANTNTVIVLDPSTLAIVGNVAVGTHPRGLAGTPDGTQLWVTNMNSNSISVINPSTQKVTATIALPSSQPYGIDITPDGTTAYIANGTTPGAVYVVDVAKQTVTATIAVGGRPFKLAVSPDGAQVYVTNNADGTVSVIDVLTNTVIQTITVGAAAFGVAWAPNGTRVYVTADGNLYVIDPSSYQIVATIAVGSYPVSVTVDPTGTEAFVCNRLSTFISHIDLTTNTVIENIAVGFSPETAVLVP